MAGTFRVEVPSGNGSAFRVTADQVLTAAHVVDGVDRVQLVPLEPQGDYLVGTVRWRDSEMDIAVLEVTADKDAPQRPLSLVPAAPGQEVYVVGAPNGTGKITTGQVTRATEIDFLANALVESGNSGGPVLDSEGNTLGMIVQGTTDGSAGRALSSQTLARAIADARINPQPLTHPRGWLSTFAPHLLVLLALFVVAIVVIVTIIVRQRANRPKPIVITLD